MRNLIKSLAALAALVAIVFVPVHYTQADTAAAISGGVHRPLAPDVLLQGARNYVPSGSTLTVDGTINVTGGKLTSNGANYGVPFYATATLTSAAGATAIHILPVANVPTGKKVFITGFKMKVNGSTVWATTATVALQDTNGSPVNFASVAVAALTANAYVTPSTANVTLGTAFSLNTGGTASKGIDLVANANGTGSDLVVTIDGFIK